MEDCVYGNLTGDTHPMHTHLVTFQVVGRTPFDADAYQAKYGVRAKYDLPTGVSAPQTYVYHYHILEHEDNDMMRPFTVTA